MFSPQRSLRRPVALLLALAASTVALTAGGRQVRVTPTTPVTPTPRPPASCATPEFRQFDFFAADGTPSLLRGVWWRDGADVREKAERSVDGGKTWTPVIDIVFRPHREA